jgi:hypothetical protein
MTSLSRVRRSSSDIECNSCASRLRAQNRTPNANFSATSQETRANLFTGPFISNENLETGARNDLKNKAAAVGGNLVVLITSAPVSGSAGEAGGSILQTNVTLSGNVYRCPT